MEIVAIILIVTSIFMNLAFHFIYLKKFKLQDEINKSFHKSIGILGDDIDKMNGYNP